MRVNACVPITQPKTVLRDKAHHVNSYEALWVGYDRLSSSGSLQNISGLLLAPEVKISGVASGLNRHNTFSRISSILYVCLSNGNGSEVWIVDIWCLLTMNIWKEKLEYICIALCRKGLQGAEGIRARHQQVARKSRSDFTFWAIITKIMRIVWDLLYNLQSISIF